MNPEAQTHLSRPKAVTLVKEKARHAKLIVAPHRRLPALDPLDMLIWRQECQDLHQVVVQYRSMMAMRQHQTVYDVDANLARIFAERSDLSSPRRRMKTRTFDDTVEVNSMRTKPASPHDITHVENRHRAHENQIDQDRTVAHGDGKVNDKRMFSSLFRCSCGASCLSSCWTRLSSSTIRWLLLRQPPYPHDDDERQRYNIFHRSRSNTILKRSIDIDTCTYIDIDIQR
jgi:hypothetical protein